jgi:hypothetical protein
MRLYGIQDYLLTASVEFVSVCLFSPGYIDGMVGSDQDKWCSRAIRWALLIHQ